MIDISDTIMYLNYYKKILYLLFLKKLKKLDYTGRIEDDNPELRGYEGCYPIYRVLRRVEPTKYDSILDIGCGKGLFLYYASKFEFNRIDGIEYSAELADIALKNAVKINDKRINVINCDARDFQQYDNYNYFFINNPFSAAITERLVGKICNSYQKKRRKITIIYQFPFHKNIFISNGFVEAYEKYPNCVLLLE